VSSLTANQPSSAGISPEPELDLRRFFQVLRRRRFLAIGALLTSLVVGILVTIRAPRIYRAAAIVFIDLNPPEVLSGVREVYALGSADYWNSKEYFETQYRVIRSRPVAERVALSLGLTGPALTGALNAAGDESLVARASGDPLLGLTPELKSKLAMVGLDHLQSREAILAALEKLDAPAMIQGRVMVDPIKDSRLVDIAVEDTDPARAAMLANAVADAYIEVNLDQKTDMTRSAVDWLSDQMHDLKTKLESSELALHDFKKDHDIVSVSMEDRQTMAAQTLSQLNGSLSAVHADRLALESRRNQIKKAIDAGAAADTVEEVSKNQLIQSLKGSRAQLKAEESDLGLRYTDDHPKLVAVREKLGLINSELKVEIEKVIAGLDQDYQAKLENETRLKQAIEEVKVEALELNREEIGYSRLKREKDNNQALYEMVLKRQKEADLSQMLKVNNVRKLEAARVPEAPIRPNVRNNLLAALLLGALGGFGLALLVDHLDNTVKTQDQVEAILELPLLGIVPTIRASKDDKNGDPTARDRFIVEHPRSSVAECSRTIRTNLLFMATERPAKKLLVTSSGPREGKSTTVINLAITMALSGSRSLLVDSDMRRPRLHKSFNLSNETGLSSLIAGNARLDQAIVASGVERLDLLPCGPIPPNPAELLHTDAFKNLLAQLEGRYERIWFDSPPVIAVTDALVLSGMADGVILVVEAGKTPWQFALQARRRLEDIGAKIFGVIVNNVDLDRTHSGDYYQYYYYHAGYHEEAKAETT